MSRRPVLRRFGAALSGLLLLQLLQLGSATQCVITGALDGAGGPVRRGVHATAHRGAQERVVTMQSASHQDTAIVAEGGDTARKDSSHCVPPDAGQCASVTSCGVIVAALSATIVEFGNRWVALELPDPASLHSTPAHAPELPPPRA